MAKLCQIFLIILSFIIKDIHATNFCLQIEGLPESFKKSIYLQISNILDTKINTDIFLRTHIDSIIRKNLKIIGYYEPTIHLTSTSNLNKKSQSLNIHINPGIPIIIRNINFILRGEAQNDIDYLNLSNKLPKIGTILNHNDFINFKKSLINISIRKGYFDAYFIKSQLSISIDKHQAFWNIDYDSKCRYRFGSVTFKGSQINNNYLKKLIPFKEGEYYESNKLAELSRRLSITNWFNSIIITPEIKRYYKNNNVQSINKILPIHGELIPKIKNSIETGIGYSTDVGFHMKILWKKPWIGNILFIDCTLLFL